MSGDFGDEFREIEDEPNEVIQARYEKYCEELELRMAAWHKEQQELSKLPTVARRRRLVDPLSVYMAAGKERKAP